MKKNDTRPVLVDQNQPDLLGEFSQTLPPDQKSILDEMIFGAPNESGVLFIGTDAASPKPTHAGMPLLICGISRQDVESCDITFTLANLRKLSASSASIKAWRGKMILSVSGYDDDPRELAEISSVRKYFAALNAAWPYWIWFLAPNRSQIVLIQLLLTKTRTIIRRNDRPVFYFDKTSEEKILNELFLRMKTGLSAMGIAPEPIDAAIDYAIDELMRTCTQ